MALWITYRDGRIVKYNNAGIYKVNTNGWVKIAETNRNLNEDQIIAEIRETEIISLEFEQPCEVTFKPDVIESSLDILLCRAKKISDWKTLGKLADLSRLLRKFNPQRKEWTI